MMKLLLVSACISLALGDVSHIIPKDGDRDATILKQEQDVGTEGEYRWSFETSNGIAAQAQGELKNAGSDNAEEVVQGSSRWTAPDGTVVEMTYVADGNGYQVQGSHVPTPPPIPEAILRSLEYIRAHPPPPEQR